MDRSLEEKYENLRDRLKSMESAVLAFSGGVDSALLLAVAAEVLGGDLLAVTARSPLYPDDTLRRGEALAQRLGVELIVVETNELADEEFTANPPERCYLCKRELYGLLVRIAAERGKAVVMDGTQVDDTRDYRPGMRAAAEFGIRSPLLEAALSKQEVRELSRKLDLPTWDLPAGPCLASRVAYRQEITAGKLTAIEKAEEWLASQGFREVRVRYTEPATARIEVRPDEIARLMEPELREKTTLRLKELGFIYVTLDLEGYRTGSMNEVLPHRSDSGED